MSRQLQRTNPWWPHSLQTMRLTSSPSSHSLRLPAWLRSSFSTATFRSPSASTLPLSSRQPTTSVATSSFRSPSSTSSFRNASLRPINFVSIRGKRDSAVSAMAAEAAPVTIVATGQQQQTKVLRSSMSQRQAELERQQREWEQWQELVNLEREWETKSVEKAVERYKKLSKNLKQLGLAFELLQGNQILAHWFEPLCTAIRAEQNAALLKADASSSGATKKKAAAKTGKKAADRELAAHLVTIPPEKLAVITIHETMTELMKSANPDGAPLGPLSLAIGRAVEYEYDCERLEKQGWKPQLRDRSGQTATKRQLKGMIRKQAKEVLGEGWSSALCAQMGTLLLKHLIATATIRRSLEAPPVAVDASATEQAPQQKRLKRQSFVAQEEALLEPAFKHHSTQTRGKVMGFLGCSDQVLALLDQEEVMRGVLQARYLPMVIPPQPWVAPDQGAYLVSRTRVLRSKGSPMQIQVLYGASMDKIYESLNLLSRTPWRINDRMYQIISDAWEKGGGIADLPSRTNVPEPEMPEEYYSDSDVKKKYDREKKRAKVTNYNLHSLRCDVTYKLQVAKECHNRTFYFPHNMDFRGRTYPIPPHLNHLGQDLCRGLLTFAEGKPLGKSGLHWLKVHLANVYGNDKIPFNERVQFVENNMRHIEESVANPLGGERWWLAADKPWQCLAASIELVNAYKSGNPEEYVSSLPIHQDGSCNGLQHYAALGGDELGARQVNLLPADRPQDVYSGVVELVVRRLEADAANGVEIAKQLRGKVDRKVIKQTVMTSVYGVTFIGARQQIENALKDRNKVPEELMFIASRYLAASTFASIKEMFSGAREIMTWLSDCATLIAKQGKPVTWVTPLGLPVVQPYRSLRKHTQSVSTALQQVVLQKDNYDDLPVNSRKHRTAFPPNFVHSLDSTHMMLTALECNKANLTYASVHDSYWTHASTVDTMNVILRQTFVELHSQPLLEDLLAHFKRTYPGVAFPPVPARGNLDLRQILNSPYFFQ